MGLRTYVRCAVPRSLHDILAVKLTEEMTVPCPEAGPRALALSARGTIEALLGTGARGEPEGLVAACVQVTRELDESGTRIVAVDLPTGVDADTGAIARRAVRADLTVTFGHPKRGHWLWPGRAFAGRVEVVDIGLVAPAAARDCPVSLATEDDMAVLVPRRGPRAHKTSVGRVVVAGGSEGLTGAVALAAHAATRTGAGYVRCAVPRSLHDILAVKLTEEMTVPCPEAGPRALALSARGTIEALLERADAFVLGSGLGRHHESASLVRALVSARTRPTVLDADGLSALAGQPFEAGAGEPLVLTPHLGEMERLTGETSVALEGRRIDAAIEWARRWNAVVVLKGAPTVTASPDGRATVNPTGNPGLATAGTGDVLAGAIGALLSQGLDAYDAARLGAFVHGLAGDRARAARGTLGLAARDVLEALPESLEALERRRDTPAGRTAR